MSKKSEMAAMKYLAKKKPGEYKLLVGKTCGVWKAVLYEWTILGSPMHTWWDWQEFHKVEFEV